MLGTVGRKGADARAGLVVRCLVVAFAHQLAYARSDEALPQSVPEWASFPKPSAATDGAKSAHEIARELADSEDPLASLTFGNWGAARHLPPPRAARRPLGRGIVDVSQTQLFLGFLPGDGWTTGSTRILSHDWGPDHPTLPITLTVGKRLEIGWTTVELEAENNHYVGEPIPFRLEWMLGLNIGPVTGRLLQGRIRGN